MMLSLLLMSCAHVSEPASPVPTMPLVVAEVGGPTLTPVGVAAGDGDLAALIERARQSHTPWTLLAELCDTVGHRLAGSTGLEAAVRWGEARLAEAGHEGVTTEPVDVPVWVRGDERLTMLAPLPRDLGLLGLGQSVGTTDLPGGAVEAEVVVVHDFDELSDAAAGRIVLFNVPMSNDTPAIEQYGATVRYRGLGASQAAAHGAVATLVRSVTARSLYTPHTGGLRYDPAQPAIPAAAITGEDADWIERLVDRGQPVRLRLELGAHTLPDAPSHNVLADVRGSEKPEEVVLIGAHLDSWDVGQGAHDDGAGIAEVMGALEAIRAQGTPPRRTVRAVLFTNEENGLRGGRAYAAAHGPGAETGEVHVAAIESDLGGGWPLAWSAEGSPEQIAWLRAAADPVGLPVEEGGSGADISPLGDEGVLTIGLRPDDSHYFDVHHTKADTLDKVDPASLSEATAALAALAWQLANAPSAPPLAPVEPAPAAP